MSRIEEHIKMNEHLTNFAEKLIVEHLFYAILQPIIEHPAIFLTASIAKRVWLLGTQIIYF